MGDIAKIQADLAKLKGQQVKQEPGDASASAAAKASAVSADEEYDPAKPCDYDALCKERIRKRAAEEMEKRRRIEEEKQRKANEPKVPEPPKEEDFATKMMKKMGWKEWRAWKG